MLPWQPNKMATGHQTHKLGRQLSNDHNCHMVLITSLVIEKKKFNHFPVISLWEISVSVATKPRDRSPQFLLFWNALTQASFVPNQSNNASVILKELSFKIFFFQNWMLPWQPNKMITGHKTHKLGRQSSDDHKCQIWLTSLHWL